MSHAKGLFCKECGREYPAEPLNVCDFCFGPLEVTYDYDSISRVISRERIAQGPRSMWRYHDLFPVDAVNAVDINAGFTPLIKAKNLAKSLGLDELYLKNDSVNPSFSFKDRVVAVANTQRPGSTLAPSVANTPTPPPTPTAGATGTLQL